MLAIKYIALLSGAGGQAAVDADAPSAIVTALFASAASADVAAIGVWALGNIARSPAGKAAVAAVGGRSAITSAMALHEVARAKGAEAPSRL